MKSVMVLVFNGKGKKLLKAFENKLDKKIESGSKKEELNEVSKEYIQAVKHHKLPFYYRIIGGIVYLEKVETKIFWGIIGGVVLLIGMNLFL